MNEGYAVRMIDIKNLMEESAASDRLALIFRLINFDEIKTVCDIGSRFLEQSIEMAYIFPQAKVHAFEPVEGSYNICLGNQAAQPDYIKERISVYNLAVSDKSEPISFYEVDNTGSEHNVGASSKYRFIDGLNGSFFGKTWNQREVVVNATTLDDWRDSNNIGPIDLIWMDAQGGELDALKGAEQTLKDVKVIFTEVGVNSYYQGQSLKPEIDQYLISQGFVELESGFKLNHPYEGDTIYIRK